MFLDSTLMLFIYRAGRDASQEAATILLVGAESKILLEPDSVFSTTLNPGSPVECKPEQQVIEAQISCAAFENPIFASEWKCFQGIFDSEFSFVQEMQKSAIYDPVIGGYIPKFRFLTSPAYQLPIRNMINDPFRLINVNGTILEEIDAKHIPLAVYHNAVHIHNGIKYLLFDIHVGKRFAMARQTTVSYHTKATFKFEFTPIDMKSACSGPCFSAQQGVMEWTQRHVGFKKIDSRSGSLIEVVQAPFHDSITNCVFGISIDFCFSQIERIQLEDTIKQIALLKTTLSRTLFPTLNAYFDPNFPTRLIFFNPDGIQPISFSCAHLDQLVSLP